VFQLDSKTVLSTSPAGCAMGPATAILLTALKHAGSTIRLRSAGRGNRPQLWRHEMLKGEAVNRLFSAPPALLPRGTGRLHSSSASIWTTGTFSRQPSRRGAGAVYGYRRGGAARAPRPYRRVYKVASGRLFSEAVNIGVRTWLALPAGLINVQGSGGSARASMRLKQSR